MTHERQPIHLEPEKVITPKRSEEEISFLREFAKRYLIHLPITGGATVLFGTMIAQSTHQPIDVLVGVAVGAVANIVVTSTSFFTGNHPY